ncbi:hypothetical protein ACHAXT_002904 [Thalassiosira profunda]
MHPDSGGGEEKAEDPDEDRLPQREGDQKEESEEGPDLEKSAQSDAERAEESTVGAGPDIRQETQEIATADEKGSDEKEGESDDDERPQTQGED